MSHSCGSHLEKQPVYRNSLADSSSKLQVAKCPMSRERNALFSPCDVTV